MRVERLAGGPIIRPEMDARIGGNINGPSLLRVPDWIEDRLGAYYLYFAHHKGTYIRMAYADDLEGPWTTYGPGVLDLEDSFFASPELSSHVASPDVHIDDENRQIRMYYHGVVERGVQRSRVALSENGIDFEAREELLGNSYLRVFQYGGYHYAIGMPGVFYRSRDGLTGFVEGPALFERGHASLRRAACGRQAERLLLECRGLSGANPGVRYRPQS